MLPAREIKMLEAELEKRKQEREVKDNEAITRLAAYEDSGLSPEEVHKLVKVLKQARESLQAAWEDDGSTTVGKQILEIIKAIDALMGGKEEKHETDIV